MVTISTSDSYCIFYVVGYDTPYQYVKVESGHFFNSVLQMNEFLFLEYQHISDDISFKVEASVEEGIIQMGIIKEGKNLNKCLIPHSFSARWQLVSNYSNHQLFT